MSGTDPMPVFVLPANDPLTARTVLWYATSCHAAGRVQRAAMVSENVLEVIEAWRRRHPELIGPAGGLVDVVDLTTTDELQSRLNREAELADRLNVLLASAIRKSERWQEIADAAMDALLRSNLTAGEAEQLRRRYDDQARAQPTGDPT